MPLRTNIGVSRKVADNNYGSRGASVNLEVELDSTLIQDPKLFHERIRQVFHLAQQAIDEELGRQQGPASHATYGSNGHAAQPSNNGNNGHAATNGNGHTATNGNGSRNGQTGNIASEKQLNFAKQLAKGIPGLGIRRLETLVQKMCGKPLAALTTLDASGLIDTLISIKAGEINLDTVLEGNAA
jgi:hypothetical protein